MYMAASCRDILVTTIEGSVTIADIARQNFTEAGLHNINVINGSFDDVISEFAEADVSPGLIFIDGNHHKEPVIKYFNSCLLYTSDAADDLTRVDLGGRR